MNDFSDVAIINQTLARAKAENMYIPETALRRWVKDGDVPASFVGKKALIYWPALMRFLQGGNAQ